MFQILLYFIIFSPPLFISIQANADTWSSWIQVISKFIGESSGTSQRLQITTAPVRGNWIDSNGNEYALCKFADAISGAGIVYHPIDSLDFYDNYLTFITSLSVPTPATESVKKLESTRLAVRSSRERLSELEHERDKAWRAFATNKTPGSTPEKQLTFEHWNSASGYGSRIVVARVELARAERDLRYLSNTISDLYSNVQEAYDPQQVRVLKDEGGYEHKCPAYEIVQINSPSKSNEIEWRLASEYSDERQSSDHETFPWPQSFVAVFNRDGQLVSRDERAFDCRIQFRDLKLVYIRPGRWYSEDLINKYRNGPFKPDSVLAGDKDEPDSVRAADKNVWGPHAKLGWHVEKVLLGYHAKVSVKFDEGAYRYAKRELQRGGRLSVGPYSSTMGDPGKQSDQTVLGPVFDDRTHMLIFEDASNDGMILGVLNGPL